MSANDALRQAQVTRVLLVDDDLSTTVTAADMDAHGGEIRPMQILADPDHDYTVDLVAQLTAHALPSGSVTERLNGLENPAVRAAVVAPLREVYNRASMQRGDQRLPLNKIKAWIEEGGKITVDEWAESRPPAAADRYDLLVVDYYLVNNDSTATIQLINLFKDLHANQPRPLLVILMSSNIADIERDFETIRDECQMSASRFRILAKPVATNKDGEDVVKEKWFCALRQLANERPLVEPIEAFVRAWEHSLSNAATQIIQRLYDIDASAFAILAATAAQDSMTLEEYLADVLARRISAATEEKSFPFNEIATLQRSLDEAKTTIGPTIDQGVEVRHAQRAIRGLMSDVVWHRSPWWRPREAAPSIAGDVMPAAQAQAGAHPAGTHVIAQKASPAQAESAAAITKVARESAAPTPASAAAAEKEGASEATKDISRSRTAERLKWLKHTVRFGTVLRKRSDSQRYLVNLTQACDVQSEKLVNVGEVHYLFMQGRRYPVDRVAIGEKSFDSPYYREESEEDEFYTLQWRLRQPFTPSIGDLLDSLEGYEIVGQLRSESAYAVLAKYMAQATRVAQVRLPRVYRYAVSVYHKMADGSWQEQRLASPIEASAWQKGNNTWRLQFTVGAARALLPYLSGVADDHKDQFVDALTSGLKVEGKSGADFHVKDIGQTTALLMRIDGRVDYDADSVSAGITAVDKCRKAASDTTVIVTRALR